GLPLLHREGTMARSLDFARDDGGGVSLAKKREHLISDRFRRFRANFTAAGGTERARHASPKQFQEIVDLCDRANARARRFYEVRLFDRDRWRDSANAVDPRLVHAFKELPHVGAEGLDVTALPFGIDGVESERRLSASARAGDNAQLCKWKIEVDAFEVILARAADFNAPAFRGSSDTFFFDDLRTHWKLSFHAMRSANFLAENTRIAHFPKGTSAPRMPVIPSASEGLRLSSRKEGRLWKHLP